MSVGWEGKDYCWI